MESYRDRGRTLSWLSAAAVAGILLSFAAITTAAAGAADNKPLTAKERQGDAIFHQRCIVCHNKQPGDMTPFGPPNLNEVFKGPNGLKAEQAQTIITNGKGQMPSFAQILTKNQISSVIAYLKTR